MPVCVHVCVCMCVCVHMCACACMYACVRVCVYVHVHVWRGEGEKIKLCIRVMYPRSQVNLTDQFKL